MASIDPHQILKKYIAEHGLKWSRQREIIADVFFQAAGHLKIDDVLERARQIDPKVSQATVYRTMKLLTDCGLAEARHFLEGQTRYEISDERGQHHDHLICTVCGRIIEFVDPRIEELQDAIAHSHQFTLTHHKMELYGICRTCRV